MGLGIPLMFRLTGMRLHWMVSGLAAHLTWTLPFGLLIMFAVLNRLDSTWEEAARDAGATSTEQPPAKAGGIDKKN